MVGFSVRFGKVKLKSRENSKNMKRYAILAVLGLCFAMIVPRASAQEDDKNHGNIGVFFDFTRLSSTTNLNMFGVGGRVGFNVAKHVVLEGEMAYDFERSFTSSVTSGGITNTSRSNLRLLHGLFGPKIQSTGPVRIFATVKGGFVNFGVGGPVTAGAINNQINNVVDGDTDAAVYPAGGIELNIGWLLSELYRRYRTLIPLGIAHGLVGLAIALSVPDRLNHHMRVGLGYLHYIS
jgi:hypothetical protein